MVRSLSTQMESFAALSFLVQQKRVDLGRLSILIYDKMLLSSAISVSDEVCSRVVRRFEYSKQQFVPSLTRKTSHFVCEPLGRFLAGIPLRASYKTRDQHNDTALHIVDLWRGVADLQQL